MLQKLNERIQGVISWVVLVLIAVTFTLFGVDYYMQWHHASDAEVEINGRPISKQAFELQYRRARQQSDASQLTAGNEQILKKQVLDDLINNQISLQAAEAGGFDVSNEQADAAILKIPQFQEDGHFSQERYQQALSGAMFTHESFQKEVRQGMLLNQQRFAFIGSAFALPGEVERFIKLYMQTRDYNYLEIPTTQFVKKQEISAEEIQKYYQHHQKEFLAPEKASIDYIRLSMEQLKKQVRVTDEQINRYYNENKSSFLTPAQWQIAHILFAVPKEASVEIEEQIKVRAHKVFQKVKNNPQQFEELVKKSDDKLSIANGGILPWLTAGQSGFDKTLASLVHPGQIAPPVRTSHGYELFKLVNYKPAVIKPLTEVKSLIQEQLTNDLVQTKYTQALDQLSDLSYQSPDSLLPVAKTLNLPIERSQLFSRQGGDSPVTKNKQVINATFNHDVLQLGNNSEPIQLDNETVMVLRVNKHVPATQKPLAEVKDYIVDKLAMQRAKLQAEQLGEQFIKSKKPEQEQLMQANNWHWQQQTNISRDTDKVDVAINDLAFSLPRVNSIQGHSLTNGNYIIVQLKKINDGQFATLDKEQQASLAQQIEASNGVMDYDLYISNLRSKAKIDKP